MSTTPPTSSPEPVAGSPRGAAAAGAPAGTPSLVSAGGWPFLLSALVGRLPAATVQLGVLLYVSGAGLGLGLAGLTVAATGLGSAVGAPLLGRLVDRFGPLFVVVGLSWLVFTIIAAIKANDGIAYRYPLTLRLIR